MKKHDRRDEFTQKNYVTQVIDAVVDLYFEKTRKFTSNSLILYEDDNVVHELDAANKSNASRRVKEA